MDAIDVGGVTESLCGTIWNITKDCSNNYATWMLPPPIKGGKEADGIGLYMARLWNSCVYQTQDVVVADQFWVCGNKTLRATLPKLWKGRCARVHVVTEVVLD